MDRYEQGDRELCYRLNVMPKSSRDYLEMDPELKAHWTPLLGEPIPNKWIPPFYTTHPDDAKPFHVVCEFYRILITCECRLMMMAAEKWVEELEMTLLQYELVSLRDELIELLKELNRRLKGNTLNDDHQNMKKYLHELLWTHLVMTIHELQLRHHSLFGKRLVEESELYLKHLEQPVPKSKSWYRTVVCTQFELRRANRPPETLSNIEGILREIQHTVESFNNPRIKEDLYESLRIVENAWLIGFIQQEGEMITTLTDSSSVMKRIERMSKALHQTGSPNKEAKSDLHRLLEKADRVKEVIYSTRKRDRSEALMLIEEIFAMFDPSAGSGGFAIGAVGESQHTSTRSGSPVSILDDYIRLDDVQNKLGVTDKIVKDYLKRSGTKVINFSNKNRWIHRDELKALMDHFEQKF